MSINRDEARSQTEDVTSYEEQQALLGSSSSLDRPENDVNYKTIRPLSDNTFRKLKWRYWKNLLSLSISVQFVWISYSSLLNLEGSLNRSQGLGLVSLAAMFLSVAIGCVFAPIIVKRLGAKNSAMFAFLCQILFAGVHFYPRFWTLVPVSILVGVTSSFQWTAVGWYVVHLATGYATIVGENTDAVLTRFTGVFVGFWQSSQVVGNLVSSLVLNKNDTTGRQTSINYLNDNNEVPLNITCGAGYCDINNESHQSVAPPSDLINILLGVYSSCCLLGLLLALCCVDEYPGDALETAGSTNEITPFWRVMATFRKHSDIRLVLLIPLFTFNGVEQCFILGVYTKAFVGCELGVGAIGFTMAAYGALDCVGSLGVAVIGRSIGRTPLYALATVINTSLLVLMLTVSPADWPRGIFYLVPSLWGLADAIWQTSTSAMLGSMFKDGLEPAWAAFLLWQGGGMAFGFITMRFVCVSTLIYIILGILAAAFSLYGGMEVMIWRSKRTTGTVLNNPPSITDYSHIS